MITDLGQIARILEARERKVIADAGRPRAAVLVPLYGPPPAYRLLYTVRTSKVEHHKGEISFPGGAREPEDPSIVDTALRESSEEVGIRGADVNVLGLLDDVVTRANFVVTPVVGHLEPYPYGFNVYEEEVAELLEVSLAHLADPGNRAPHPLFPEGPPSSYRFGQHLIYGVTAFITSGLLRLLRE